MLLLINNCETKSETKPNQSETMRNNVKQCGYCTLPNFAMLKGQAIPQFPCACCTSASAVN